MGGYTVFLAPLCGIMVAGKSLSPFPHQLKFLAPLLLSLVPKPPRSPPLPLLLQITGSPDEEESTCPHCTREWRVGTDTLGESTGERLSLWWFQVSPLFPPVETKSDADLFSLQSLPLFLGSLLPSLPERSLSLRDSPTSSRSAGSSDVSPSLPRRGRREEDASRLTLLLPLFSSFSLHLHRHLLRSIPLLP